MKALVKHSPKVGIWMEDITRFGRMTGNQFGIAVCTTSVIVFQVGISGVQPT